MKMPNVTGYNEAVISRVLETLEGENPLFKLYQNDVYLGHDSPGLPNCGCARGAIRFDLLQANEVLYHTRCRSGCSWSFIEAEHAGLPEDIVLRMESIFEGCSDMSRSSGHWTGHTERRKYAGDGKRVARFLRRCLKISASVQAAPAPKTVKEQHQLV